jgi:hypothetical protein
MKTTQVDKSGNGVDEDKLCRKICEQNYGYVTGRLIREPIREPIP